MPRPRDHVLVPTGPRVALGELSEDGADRLVADCLKARHLPREFVEGRLPRGPGLVAGVNGRMRELVWSDVEVREALLHMDFGELVAVVEEAYGGPGPRFSLLDLVCGMSYEAGQRGAAS